jgi:TPP-dependent pyruvate/acetoin dehydrogenase alpha subunit
VSGNVPTDTLLAMYASMWRIRRFEEAAGHLYKQGVIKGGIHAAIGQEAVSVGVAFAMEKGDWFSSTHRGHAHHIAGGADLNRLMAEVRAKSDGYCSGRGGSMHVAAFEAGSLGAYPVVAAGVPVALGAALSESMRGTGRISVAYFGDGALGQGTLYECLNLATVWKLPVVFVCENNRLAVSTSVEKSIAVKDFAKLAETFGMPGGSVNGSDVRAVHAAALEAVARARAGDGPSLIECSTHRFEGHYFGEPQVYRSRDEVKALRETKDPIDLLERHLLTKASAPAAELEKTAADATQAVEDALAFAAASPDPDPGSYEEFVYA